jgi:hypothetical protein
MHLHSHRADLLPETGQNGPFFSNLVKKRSARFLSKSEQWSLAPGHAVAALLGHHD